MIKRIEKQEVLNLLDRGVTVKVKVSAHCKCGAKYITERYVACGYISNILEFVRKFYYNDNANTLYCAYYDDHSYAHVNRCARCDHHFIESVNTFLYNIREKRYQEIEREQQRLAAKPHDSLLDKTIWSHGLSAFSRCTETEAITRLLDITNHKEWEICCAHKSQRIGPIGVYVKGNVIMAFNKDALSKIGHDNKRYYIDEFNMYDEGYVDYCSIATEEDRDYYENLFSKKPIKTKDEFIVSDDHNEIIISSTKIVGIWINDKAYCTQELINIANTLNIKIYKHY